ncbi:MAG: TIGR03435 family protein [Candidatus Acidiferrales bacterium]
MVIQSPRGLAVLVLLLCLPTLQAQTKLKTNESAPPLTIEQLLNAPQETRATWDSLRGKAVVLEFWATWCGGCVANIPHLNSLVTKFSGRPIQFLSITDESKDVVTRFLKQISIDGWIALDSNDATFKAYQVLGRPTMALVDSNGVLRAITGSPSSVNAEVLDDLLAGRPLNFPDSAEPPPSLGLEPDAPPPLVEVLIRPAAPTAISGYSPGGEKSAGGRFDAWGLTLLDILSGAYDIPEQRIDAPKWFSEERYDLSVTVPQGEESQRWPLVRQSLAVTFYLQLERKPRETDVYILRELPHQQPKLRAATSAASSHWHRNGKYAFIGAKVTSLTSLAQASLNLPVFDETGLTGRYDFELTLNGDNEASIAQAFREQLGLELVPSKRKLEYLVVKSAAEPRTW